MYPLRGPLWGPRPLPEHLLAQLDARGLAPIDAPACVRQIAARPGAAAEASLFVDLGACKFLEGDIDGAVASWRQAISAVDDEPAARALLNLGLLYEHLELYESAMGVLGVIGDRGDVDQVTAAAMATARCQQASGRGDDAMETMARLAQSTMMSKPDSTELAEVLYGLGDIAERAGRVDRAERAWRVASVGPESAVQQAATHGLIRVVLDQGHDDELPELLDRLVDPLHVAGTTIDRASTLVRLGRQDLAGELLGSLAGHELGESDRFRMAEVRLEVGLVNEAIDDLEVLLGQADAEIQCRAAFTLGEIYRTYDMSDAAESMHQRVIDHGDSYWSPKAMLAIGDVLHTSGATDAARSKWVAASTSEVAAVRDAARERILTVDRLQADQLKAQAQDGDHPSPVDQDSRASNAAEDRELEDPRIDDAPDADDSASVEPIQVRLSDLASSDDITSPTPTEAADPVVIVLAALDDDVPTERSDAVPNPYAALAPDGHESDVEPSTRNPYAELAPNFASDTFEPDANIEPGDWESMLDERWSADEPQDQAPVKKKSASRAFSRYTS